MKYLLLLLASLPIWCQNSQNVVYQKLFTNVIVTGPSFVVQNIGQSQHQFVYIATSRPSQTCNFAGDFRIEGSFDGTTYFPLASVSSVTLTGVLNASGTYPKIRVNIVQFATSQCQISGWYVGTNNQNSSNDSTFAVSGLQFTSGSSAVAGDKQLVGLDTSFKITVYGLYLYNSGGTNSITVSCKTSGGAVTDQGFISIPSTPAIQIVWPSSVRAYGQCPNSTSPNNLILNTSAATNISWWVLYRYE